MNLEKIAKIYSDENNPAAPSVGTFLAMAKHEKEFAAKEKAEGELLASLTSEQQKFFEIFKDAWMEIDTILELEAFRQGVLSAEKKRSFSEYRGWPLNFYGGSYAQNFRRIISR